MSSFTTSLISKDLGDGRFKLMQPFSYHVGEEDSDNVITVPIGFVTDYASIPSIFYTLIGPPTGRYGKAAVIHDYLYDTQTTTRKEADKIFLEAMKVLKVPWWKRRMMWFAVRVGAGWIWKRHAKELKEDNA